MGAKNILEGRYIPVNSLVSGRIQRLSCLKLRRELTEKARLHKREIDL